MQHKNNRKNKIKKKKWKREGEKQRKIGWEREKNQKACGRNPQTQLFYEENKGLACNLRNIKVSEKEEAACLYIEAQQKIYKEESERMKIKTISKQEIEQVLETEVRPKLLQHQGDVQIVGWGDDRILKIRLTGKCSGCPSASLTTEEVIATAVKERIPQVKDVILVNEVSSELIELAKQLMHRRRESA